jgi:hypothetical protein
MPVILNTFQYSAAGSGAEQDEAQFRVQEAKREKALSESAASKLTSKPKPALPPSVDEQAPPTYALRIHGLIASMIDFID